MNKNIDKLIDNALERSNLDEVFQKKKLYNEERYNLLVKNDDKVEKNNFFIFMNSINEEKLYSLMMMNLDNNENIGQKKLLAKILSKLLMEIKTMNFLYFDEQNVSDKNNLDHLTYSFLFAEILNKYKEQHWEKGSGGRIKETVKMNIYREEYDVTMGNSSMAFEVSSSFLMKIIPYVEKYLMGLSEYRPNNYMTLRSESEHRKNVLFIRNTFDLINGTSEDFEIVEDLFVTDEMKTFMKNLDVYRSEIEKLKSNNVWNYPDLKNKNILYSELLFLRSHFMTTKYPVLDSSLILLNDNMEYLIQNLRNEQNKNICIDDYKYIDIDDD